MRRFLPLVCALVLLAGSGVGQRLWSGAWSLSNEPAAAAARLEAVPLTVGDWEAMDKPLDKRQLDRAEATGSLSRLYRQRGSGAEVSVLIICGRPGPVCVHTPDICYAGLGFQVAGAESRYKYEGDDAPAAEFVAANFEKTDAIGKERLRIYWGWKGGSGWLAPNNPRLALGAAKALYKIYLVYRPLPGTELTAKDPCQDLMRDLLPELEKALSPAS